MKFSFKIHRDGYVFVGIFIVVSLLIGQIWSGLGWIGVITTLWCVSFFRDPPRVTPVDDRYIISPADGVIKKIEEVNVPIELALKETGKRVRISIFLSVFDVHVNRSPVSGVVSAIKYVEGKFFNATLDKASALNERNYLMVTLKNGKNVIFTQIAGLIARRILCDTKKGAKLLAGQKYGFIRFGSRMDVYLPKGEVPKVLEGQRVIGGETILAVMGDKKTVKGEIR